MVCPLLDGFYHLRYMTKEHAAPFKLYSGRSGGAPAGAAAAVTVTSAENVADAAENVADAANAGVAAAAENVADAANAADDADDADAADVAVEGEPIRPWLMPGGGVNARFLAGLKRRVLGVVLAKPGVSEWEVVGSHLSPALTPWCATEVVDMMLAAGELLVRTAPPQRDEHPPPPLLLRAEVAAKLAAVAAGEPPERHLFAPLNPARWPR